jgi:GxxExxY protein
VLDPSPEQDRVASQIVDAAFAVHVTLGPGLLESVYEQCLNYELELRGLLVRRQVQQPIVYKTPYVQYGLSAGHGCR